VLGIDERGVRAVLEESGKVQVVFCVCADCESDQLPLGPEGVHGVFRGRPRAEVEGA